MIRFWWLCWWCCCYFVFCSRCRFSILIETVQIISDLEKERKEKFIEPQPFLFFWQGIAKCVAFYSQRGKWLYHQNRISSHTRAVLQQVLEINIDLNRFEFPKLIFKNVFTFNSAMQPPRSILVDWKFEKGHCRNIHLVKSLECSKCISTESFKIDVKSDTFGVESNEPLPSLLRTLSLRFVCVKFIEPYHKCIH